MDFLDDVPSGCSTITPVFVDKWKKAFSKIAEHYLAEKGYFPVNSIDIAKKLGCIIAAIPDNKLGEKNGNGNKIIGFLNMRDGLPIISIKADYDYDYNKAHDYRSDGKAKADTDSADEWSSKKLIPSRLLNEARSNRFVTAYYAAAAIILKRNPLLEDPTYHIMYDGYDNASLYLEGLPYYFALQLLLNEKTRSKCDGQDIKGQEHFLAVDSFLIEKANVVSEKSIPEDTDKYFTQTDDGQMTFLTDDSIKPTK